MARKKRTSGSGLNKRGTNGSKRKKDAGQREKIRRDHEKEGRKKMTTLSRTKTLKGRWGGETPADCCKHSGKNFGRANNAHKRKDLEI